MESDVFPPSLHPADAHKHGLKLNTQTLLLTHVAVWLPRQEVWN